MSNIVLSHNASNGPAWKQLDELAAKASTEDYASLKKNLTFSMVGPSSSSTSEKETSSVSPSLAFDMQRLQDQLFDILDMAEQVISVPTEEQHQVETESSSSPSQSSPSEQQTQIYGFQTDSTWDEFCDDLPLE